MQGTISTNSNTNSSAPRSPEQMREFFQLLSYSTMSAAEKKWWIGLAPMMQEDQFKKLLEVLHEEVKKITDLSLKVTAMRQK